jgi:hypothetical protein
MVAGAGNVKGAELEAGAAEGAGIVWALDVFAFKSKASAKTRLLERLARAFL